MLGLSDVDAPDMKAARWPQPPLARAAGWEGRPNSHAIIQSDSHNLPAVRAESGVGHNTAVVERFGEWKRRGGIPKSRRAVQRKPLRFDVRRAESRARDHVPMAVGSPIAKGRGMDQIQAVPSLDPVRIWVPSGLNSHDCTVPSWRRWREGFSLPRSQRRGSILGSRQELPSLVIEDRAPRGLAVFHPRSPVENWRRSTRGEQTILASGDKEIAWG